MSDVVTLARNARESLARGLNALQGDPNTPRHLLDLAAPIAQAMGALHQIERSGGAQFGPAVQSALASLQSALAQLQAQPPQHPAVAAALEAVAGALGSVHALARSAAPPQRPAPPVAPQAQQFAATQAAPAPQPQRAAPARPPPQPARAPAPPPQPAPAPAFIQQQAAPPAAASPRGAAPVGDFATVSAELGAHSVSNFYKGLSGNDIIDHGGLFVSTYKLPKIGQQVRLRVSLPGGYEFEANAVVRWRREASDAGSDAPPGFGAQFRQLVYRYVRNREPLFHDDF